MGTVAIDPVDRAVVIGGFVWGSITGHSSAGESDVVVIRYSHDGTMMWSRQVGTSTWDGAHQLAIDPSTQTIAVVGSTGGIFPNTGRVSAAGNGDLLVISYDPNGTLVSAIQHGTSEPDYGTAITFDTSTTPAAILVRNSLRSCIGHRCWTRGGGNVWP